MKRLYAFLPMIAVTCLFFSCVSKKTSRATAADTKLDSLPTVDREFRAAWVATVANIDWPSKPGLSTEQQQQEVIALLDFLKSHHFNAVVLQVRPQCDALYESSLEPWSYYLTGKQGKAPDPYYDPLRFWTEAAHDRGLELHVWLNPYRAHHTAGKEISDSSIVKKRPDLVVPLKQGYWWMDPAKQGTQDHSTAVVMDIVKRYDIDGVHFDDYFYPYPEYNGGADFPDEESWNAYQQSGGTMTRGDWRRDAVNKFIERVYRSIKAEKPHVKFGLSPFGMWRPGHPSSIQGFDQYGVLYADAKLWLNEGWIDYFSPQLYWPINRISASFPVLLGWWQGQNTKGRHLWPGISVGRDSSAKNVNEILSQIMISRGMLPNSMGVVHWNISSLTKNPKMADALLEGPYKRNALVPASPWLGKSLPDAPSVTYTIQDSVCTVTWAPVHEQPEFRWVVYQRIGNRWEQSIADRNDRTMNIPAYRTVSATNKQRLTQVIVTAVDRLGNESERKVVDIR